MEIKDLEKQLLAMPMIKKYWDKYQPMQVWLCSNPVEIKICFKQDARKNYFGKTIQQIKSFGVLDVEYEKAQDETVSDCLRIWVK